MQLFLFREQTIILISNVPNCSQNAFNNYLKTKRKIQSSLRHCLVVIEWSLKFFFLFSVFFFNFSMTVQTSYLWRCFIFYICLIISWWCYWIFSLIENYAKTLEGLIQVKYFWQVYLIGFAYFILYHIKNFTKSAHLTISDVDFVHLVTMITQISLL